MAVSLRPGVPVVTLSDDEFVNKLAAKRRPKNGSVFPVDDEKPVLICSLREQVPRQTPAATLSSAEPAPRTRHETIDVDALSQSPVAVVGGNRKRAREAASGLQGFLSK